VRTRPAEQRLQDRALQCLSRSAHTNGVRARMQLVEPAVQGVGSALLCDRRARAATCRLLRILPQRAEPLGHAPTAARVRTASLPREFLTHAATQLRVKMGVIANSSSSSSSLGCPLMKQRSQATGSVETSNLTQAPAAGRYNQTTGSRPSQDHVTDSYIRGTGGTVLLSHRWRHTQLHREKSQNPGQAATV